MKEAKKGDTRRQKLCWSEGFSTGEELRMYKGGFFGNKKKRGEWEEGRKYVWKRKREGIRERMVFEYKEKEER